MSADFENENGTGVVTADGLTLTAGSAIVAEGTVLFTGLPTADPHIVGALWLNSHVVTVSAG